MIVDIKNRVISVGKHTSHLRELAHMVKTGNIDAINEAASMMAKFINKKHVLIPVPGHKGDAEYTWLIAEKIASLKGAKVIDAIQGFERESSHEAKRNGYKIDHQIWFYKIADVPEENIILIDNCFSTGKTMQMAMKAVGSEKAIGLTITNAKRYR